MIVVKDNLEKFYAVYSTKKIDPFTFFFFASLSSYHTSLFLLNLRSSIIFCLHPSTLVCLFPPCLFFHFHHPTYPCFSSSLPYFIPSASCLSILSKAPHLPSLPPSVSVFLPCSFISCFLFPVYFY